MPNILVSAKNIILDDGKVLMVKQGGPTMYFWDLPGGELNMGKLRLML